MYLNVSDIQHFSTGDGPGVRSTVFLKGCNLRCPWCHNPETVSPEPQTLIFKDADMTLHRGVKMTVDEVVEKVLADIDFYRQSGGGVTVSGGEPLLQHSAVAELLNELHINNVHTLIDTAGSVPFECFTSVLPYTDCFYFDYKSPSRELYKTVIGGDSSLVEYNLSRLIKAGKNVHVRIPVIPSFNDSPSDVEAFIKNLSKIGVEYLDIIPFHRMASGKYEALGKPYAYGKVNPPSAEQIQSMASSFGNYFSVTVEA